MREKEEKEGRRDVREEREGEKGRRDVREEREGGIIFGGRLIFEACEFIISNFLKKGCACFKNSALHNRRAAPLKKSANPSLSRAVLVEKAQPFLHSEGLRFSSKAQPFCYVGLRF